MITQFKIYENFIKKAWNKLVEPKSDKWTNEERSELNKYNFIFTDNIAIYQSQYTDLKVIVRIVFIKTVFGKTDSPFRKLFSLQLSDSDTGKKYKDFNKIVKLLKEIIPKEELIAKKYNL